MYLNIGLLFGFILGLAVGHGDFLFAGFIALLMVVADVVWRWQQK